MAGPERKRMDSHGAGITSVWEGRIGMFSVPEAAISISIRAAESEGECE